MSKLVDKERLAKLAKALDDRAKAAVAAENERALAAEQAIEAKADATAILWSPPIVSGKLLFSSVFNTVLYNSLLYIYISSMFFFKSFFALLLVVSFGNTFLIFIFLIFFSISIGPFLAPST